MCNAFLQLQSDVYFFSVTVISRAAARDRETEKEKKQTLYSM